MRLPKLSLVVLLFTCPVIGQTSPDPNLEQTVIAAARARASAFADGDCQKWSTFVDSNFRDIEGNGSTSVDRIVRECQHARTLPDYKVERILSDFHVQSMAANFALLDYRYEVKEQFGSIVLTDVHRQVDTYENRQGKWVALVAVSAIELTDPPAAQIDANGLDGLVGQYEWIGSRMVDTVTRQGNKLFLQSTDDLEPTELLPEGPDQFFIPGQLARLAFSRDKSGKVVEEHAYSPTDGQGYRAKKIR